MGSTSRPTNPNISWDKEQNLCGIHRTRWDQANFSSATNSGDFSGSGPGPQQGQICYEEDPSDTRSASINNTSSRDYVKYDPQDLGYTGTGTSPLDNQGLQFDRADFTTSLNPYDRGFMSSTSNMALNGLNAPGPAIRRNDFYRAPNRITTVTLPPAGEPMTASRINQIRARLRTELPNWGLISSYNGLNRVLDPGDPVSRNDYNEIVGALNQILVQASGDGETRSQRGWYWNWDLYQLRLSGQMLNSIGVGVETHSDHPTLTDWRMLVDRFNTIKNSCVCNRDCSCNWVCGAYQTCRCNSYYNSGICDTTTEDVRNYSGQNPSSGGPSI